MALVFLCCGPSSAVFLVSSQNVQPLCFLYLPSIQMCVFAPNPAFTEVQCLCPQAARQKIQTLETNVENFLSRESKMKHMIRSLEQERAAYQKTIERMRSCLPPDALTDVEMTQIKTGPNGKAKTTAKKPWWQPGGWLLWADTQAGVNKHRLL